ncbi:MAG: GTP-binding protein [Clostridium sp.]|nr:GTP-binding protein [Clostridium sp.]
MEKKNMPVLLLTGYLGSGKTTLVNHILTNERGIKFAVIVNDIGEVNIDADLIQKGGIVGQNDDSLVALQNGCICCTLKMDLVKQIQDIIDMRRFDYIVIEASGICEPEPIAQTICMMPRMDARYAKEGAPVLDCVCTVVDALRLRDEFECGDSLQADSIDDEDIENLIIQQIEFCNIILLNKASEISASELERIRKIVRALQPKAEIIECDYADVDLSLLINTHKFSFGDVALSATWVNEMERPLEELEEDERSHEHEHHHEHGHGEEHEHEHEHHHEHEHEHHHEHEEEEGHEGHHHHHHHHHHDEGEAEEYGISTFVYYRRPAFDLNKFDYFVATKWPKSVIRSKGVCYFSQNPDMSYLFEQAGKQKKLTEAGQWYATAPKEELAEFMRRDPSLAREWDDAYGDRMQKIVFIGHDMDRAQITADLDACLEK